MRLHVLWALLLALATSAVTAQEAAEAEVNPLQFDYWIVEPFEDGRGAQAVTWVGAEDGAAGPSREESSAVLTVFYSRIDGTCVPSIEILAGSLFPRFEVIELQVDSRTPHPLQLLGVDQDGNRTALGVSDERTTAVLEEFQPGSFVTARVLDWEAEAPLGEYAFPLYGFTASTQAARESCEPPPQNG